MHEDPTDIVERQVARAERAKQDRAAAAVIATRDRRVMSNADVRAFVRDLLEPFFLSTFVPGVPSDTVYFEGKRATARELYVRLIENCPELVRRMEDEFSARRDAKGIAS